MTKTNLVMYHDKHGRFTDRSHSVEYQREMNAKKYLARNEAKRKEKKRINNMIMRAAKIGAVAGFIIGGILGGIIF